MKNLLFFLYHLLLLVPFQDTHIRLADIRHMIVHHLDRPAFVVLADRREDLPVIVDPALISPLRHQLLHIFSQHVTDQLHAGYQQRIAV